MNKPSKCKNCQWYCKPYWSIINPCDNCPNENDYKTIIMIDEEPVFKETLTEEQIKKAMTDKSIFEITIEEKAKEIENLQKELQRKDNIINGIKEELNKNYNTYVCKNKSYGKTFKAGAEVYKEHLLYKIKELENDN